MCARQITRRCNKKSIVMKKGLLEVMSYHRSRKSKTKPPHLDELDSERQKAPGQGSSKFHGSMVSLGMEVMGEEQNWSSEDSGSP